MRTEIYETDVSMVIMDGKEWDAPNDFLVSFFRG